MRQAIRTKGVRTQTSYMKSFAPPVGGWNARDALADMHPADAIVLKNWFPLPSSVEARGGHAAHATGMTGVGKSLFVHNKLTGTNQMFAATASGIYNVSAAGAVGAAVLVRTNGKHQSTMFGDGTSNWTIAVNGVDKPAYYDGTTWTAVDSGTTPALTGLTTTKIIGVNVFKGRLFFIEKDSLSAWYLPAGAAGGALLEIDLSSEATAGGYLVAMATWTRDSGTGLDDVAVFITSQGEALVYQGTNPSSASFWGKIGTFKIGKPLGYQCVSQYAGEVVILTEGGVFLMSSLLQAGETERQRFALSYKIQDAMTTVARSYGATFGWSATVFPARNALLINIPIAEDGEHEQYVMNTITKAWCRFTEWDAEALCVFNGELYFTRSTLVQKAWTGTGDLDLNIDFYAKQAFQMFGDDWPKQVKLFQPILAVNGEVTYASDVDIDFADEEMAGQVTVTVTAGAVWDASNWDEAYWAQSTVIVKQWSSPAEYPGRWIAGKLKITSNSITAQWMGSTIVYEQAPAL